MTQKRNKKATKKQISARVNINLMDRIDCYIEDMNKKGLTVKKVDIIEQALFNYMEALQNDNK